MNQGKSFPRIRFSLLSLLVIVGLLSQTAAFIPAHASQGQASLPGDDPNRPASAVKLIFIHHSTGENWLADDNGGLGIALGQNNYFVSDTNYGWGPDGIGDNTDIPYWLDWFRSAETPTYTAALYAESGQHSSYTRTLSNPGGENEIIMFKSCFPNSALEGNPTDPPSPDGWLTVGHAKYVYNQLLLYFREHPNKLFVVITAPPLSNSTYAANARAFNQWLMNDWLAENHYALQNVAVFDFYNVLTGPDHHHRYYNGQVQHVFTPGANTLYYPSGDDHPSQAGNLKATSEFVTLLNVFYHRWKNSLAGPNIQGCPLFPGNNIWNLRVDTLPVHTRSEQWITNIGPTTGFHMDFGSGTWEGGPIGIPYNIVNVSSPSVPVTFYYAPQSDPGPYPIPANPLIEWGSDHHLLMVNTANCYLYEIYDASYSSGAWGAGSGAIWNLNSNALRPDTWTSADAAGLPMVPGLVRYDEIVSGQINHAIRFTASQTNGYIWPARHLTSNNPGAPQIPPMGARFRLKSSYNISGFPAEMQVILRAMQQYGIILADNGSDWYISGEPDERWDNDQLHLLDVLTGNDFEAVDASWWMVNVNSGAVKASLADFNADNKTDVSIFRPSTGQWFVKDQFATNWGVSGDIPVPGDYNGDHKSDLAIFRPSTGQWYVKNLFAATWGVSGDVPVPGDYNGDGTTDLAIYRPSTGQWFVKDQFAANWGVSGDIPVPGDYNSDGATDIAIFRPSTGQWFVRNQFAANWGLSTDIPVPGDYNGDGTTDIAVYRPSTGQWFVKDQFAANWGLSSDIPVPADYNGDGKADIAIYRPSTGQWFVKDQFAANWGLNSDYPVPAPDTNGDGDPYQDAEQ